MNAEPGVAAIGALGETLTARRAVIRAGVDSARVVHFAVRVTVLGRRALKKGGR